MKRPDPIPAVVPVVSIVIGDDDYVQVDVDGTPFPVPGEWARLGVDAVGQVMEVLRDQVRQVARVNVTFPDGSVESEIITPEDANGPGPRRADAPAPAAETPVRQSSSASFLGIAEPGFRPGEKVSIAVVVATTYARADSVAAFRMPPGLLARKPFAMVLLGSDSGYLVVHDPTPDRAGAA